MSGKACFPIGCVNSRVSLYCKNLTQISWYLSKPSAAALLGVQVRMPSSFSSWIVESPLLSWPVSRDRGPESHQNHSCPKVVSAEDTRTEEKHWLCVLVHRERVSCLCWQCQVIWIGDHSIFFKCKYGEKFSRSQESWKRVMRGSAGVVSLFISYSASGGRMLPNQLLAYIPAAWSKFLT